MTIKISFDTAPFTLKSHTRPKILSLITVTLSHINNVIMVPPIKSYLNQCSQVSQLLKYDGNIVIT